MWRRTNSFLFGCVLFAASSTAAAYTFDDQCAPRTEHAPGIASPNVMLVVDRSGSMDYEMSPGKTRWQTAKDVISEVVVDLERPGSCPMDGLPGCDPVRFGLGYFSTRGVLSIEPDDGTAGPIVTSLNSTNPSGGTQTHTAVDVVVSSARLNDDSRSNAAVLVTDGAPDLANTARTAVRSICNVRNRGVARVSTYVVGFGPGSNQAVNGFMAAAGGTGQCCVGAAYPCDAAHEVDPCDLNAAQLNSAVRDTGADDSTYIASQYSCGGSLEATNGEAFKAALLDIADEVACTFPLDIPPDYPNDSADPDPDATLVEIGHALYGVVRAPYCAPGDTNCGLGGNLQALGIPASEASAFADEGWYFADPTRRSVRLTEGLCGQIQSRDVEKIYTQVACVCRLTGESCTYTIDGFTNEQLENMRCSAGLYVCVNGQDVCEPQFGRMPEICNGIDDDCDGFTDNMAKSWDDPAFSGAEYDLPADAAGIECNLNDVCVCPGGAQDAIDGDTPASFYDSWGGSCACGENLTPDEPVAEADSETLPAADDAACSAAGATGGSGLAFLLLGLVAGVRRRRR